MLGQRRCKRVDFYCPVELTLLWDGTKVPGACCDISYVGAGICAQKWVDRGQTVRIQFHLRNPLHKTVEEEVMARVVYCMADEDGDRMGIEFSEALDPSKQPNLIRRLNNL